MAGGSIVDAMTELAEEVLALSWEDKRALFEALRADLEGEPIPEIILQGLEERRRQRHSGENPVDSVDNAFRRLLGNYGGEV